MKELSIEEKAKAYDEVVEKLSKLYRDYDSVSNLIDVKEELENILPEIKENEDEMIRKELIEFVNTNTLSTDERNKKWIAWLEKQAEHAKFRDSIQVGDKVTRNQDGVLVNLSQLERVAKKDEKQGEQKSDKIVEKAKTEKQRVLLTETDGSANIDWDCRSLDDVKLLLEYGLDYIKKLEKQGEVKTANNEFKVGDWVINTITKEVEQVIELTDNEYICSGHLVVSFNNQHLLKKWTFQDAKDGDVLYSLDSKQPFIFKHRKTNEQANVYCGINIYGKFFVGNTKDCIITTDKYIPATKEQRDTFFAKMKEAGYELDAEKRELKKIEDEEYNGEDYGIDSLYHAQRILEKTLGSVDGYQSDDGILEHKCAISAVKKLYEQKPKWSEEDKSIRPQKQWKPTEKQMKAIEHICDGNIHVDLDILDSIYKDFKKLREK